MWVNFIVAYIRQLPEGNIIIYIKKKLMTLFWNDYLVNKTH